MTITILHATAKGRFSYLFLHHELLAQHFLDWKVTFEAIETNKGQHEAV
jgi:hypothetical protein